MTASDLAQILEARRTGAGKWQARCPAHSERSPRLNLGEAKDGRILLHCFAGCTLPEILAALGLCVCDLFEGPPPAQEQAIALMAAREARERAVQAEREARRSAWDRVRRWESIVEMIGAKLAVQPENDALGKVFDQACYRLHDSEIAEFEVRP